MAVTYERTSPDYLVPLMPREEDFAVRYAVLLSRNALTGRYTASMPDLPGFTCEGATVDEAKGILLNAVSSWIHTMRDRGESVPEPAEYLLDSVDILPGAAQTDERDSAQQFADVVSPVVKLIQEAQHEFLIAESAVLSARPGDATRHMEWCMDVLMRARDTLCQGQPHGELERIYKLIDYGLTRSMQAAKVGLRGTCENNIDVMKQAEDIYVQGMQSAESGLNELNRFLARP